MVRKKKEDPKSGIGGDGFAFTTGGKNFILPEKEKAKLAAKNEAPMAQFQQQENVKRQEELAQLEQELPPETIPQAQPGTQEQAQTQQKPSLLETAKNIAFGNVIEQNPFTGERAMSNGQPVETSLGVAPLAIAGAGAAAGVGLIPKALPAVKSFASLKSILTLGAIGTAIKLKASTAGNILSISETAKGDVIESYTSGAISYEQAVELFNRAEANISEAHSSANILSKIDLFGFLGLQDTLQKFQWNDTLGLKMRDLELARAEIQLKRQRVEMLRSQLGVTQGGAA